MRAACFAQATAIAVTAIFTVAAAPGCAADATRQSESTPEKPSTEVPSSSVEAKILAQVTGPGSTVTFREIEPGQILIDESVPANAQALLFGVHGATPLDTYRILTKGQEPPAELKGAEAQRLQINASLPKGVSPGPAPASAPSPDVSEIVPLETPGQSGFTSSICGSNYPLAPYLVGCVTGTGFVETPSAYSDSFQAEGFNDPTSPTTAILFYNYDDPAFGWTSPWWASVPPGTYAYFLFYGAPAWRNGSVLGSGSLGTAGFAWTPTVSASAGSWSNTAAVSVSGFAKDTAVAIELTGGPFAPNTGLSVGVYPSGVGDVPLVGGSTGAPTLVLWNCFTSETVPVAFTLTATGNISGAVASAQVQLQSCWGR